MGFVATLCGERGIQKAAKRSFGWRRPSTWICLLTLVTASAMIFSSSAIAQTTVAQGSIQGTVTDPSGAVVSGAKITITNKATGQVVTTTTSSGGTYSSGGLIVGDYAVRVEAKGFKTTQFIIPVQVAVTAAGSVKLEVGQESTVVEVQGAAVSVNTEQATVQGVLTGEQIDNLPVNGRNFLDLAQLEPGVQMQDGTTFDPTKAGYSSVSINGVFGRTPRIEVDGLDVSDETVGTTTQNIAMSSIQEFNISRSSLDLSTEVTASGAINLATRSGTNAYHGQAFYNFRDERAGFANFPDGAAFPFQRNQFGGRFGGAFVKDKLFFFIDAERIKQDSFNAVSIGAPFGALSGGYTSPFRSTQMSGKLDWQAKPNIHVFYKFAYDWNYSNSDAFAGNYSIYSNRDNTPSHAVGVDWNKGAWSHSFRFGYLKFHNLIGGGTGSLSGSQNPVPGDGIGFADTNFSSGPNFLAPQQTYQSNKQVKYDGSKVWGSHILRFGATVNRILGGGFASFYGLGPGVTSYIDDAAAFGVGEGTLGYSCNNTNFAGCNASVLAYPIIGATLSNGQGFFTEKAGFGAPAGGQSDTRFEAYVGDSWKFRPNLTLTYGLRYLRDTGRTDSDLAPIPCSATTLITCTGNLLDQWGPGLGNRVRQPNTNFGPQVGFAWDPTRNGKTVIRGGAGIYYENSIFNNVLFDRPGKLASGLFWATANLSCSVGAFQGGTKGKVGVQFPGSQGLVTSIDGLDLGTQVCFNSLGTAGQAVADLQKAYDAAVAAAGPASNANYVGNTLTLGPAAGYAAYAPNYRSTRAYQMNIGIQREIVKGGVLSADFVRNVSLHFPLTIDVNHVGDARYLNKSAAINAISVTNSNFGCGYSATPAAINCAISGASNNGVGATIGSYTGISTDSAGDVTAGLGSAHASLFGYGPAGFGLTVDQSAAFGGINPEMGVGYFQYPAGRSVYNALQTEYKQQVHSPFRGVTGMNLQIAYTLSRYEGNGGDDQNFSAGAYDFRNPTGFFGPTSLDATHQFKFGATFDIAHRGPRLSFIGGFRSAHPSNLFLNSPGQFSPAEIFRTDLTGDGTVGDLINAAGGKGKPGTFMRDVSPGGLGSVISNFNSNVAGSLTPAGQALVSAGLFTQQQLTALGAVVPTIAAPPANNAGNSMYKDVDTVLTWPIKIKERFTVEPSIGVFNLFNFANFASLGSLSTPLGQLNGGPGSPNGTIGGNDPSRNVLRSGLGTGVFAAGAPREMEFGLRIDF